jgi:hypothetical protein
MSAFSENAPAEYASTIGSLVTFAPLAAGAYFTFFPVLRI